MAADVPPENSLPERRSPLQSPWVWALFTGVIAVTMIRPLLRRVPDPPPVLGQLPAFELIDQTGSRFSNNDLAGEVYVASFFFSRCPSICPRVLAMVEQLKARYEAAGISEVRLVTFSVDPEHDDPERLREVAAQHAARPGLWNFLTGPTEDVRRLVEGGFRLPAGLPESIGEGMIDIAHSGRLVLVDGQGRVRGYYDSTEVGVDEVFHRSLHVVAEQRRS